MHHRGCSSNQSNATTFGWTGQWIASVEAHKTIDTPRRCWWYWKGNGFSELIRTILEANVNLLSDHCLPDSQMPLGISTRIEARLDRKWRWRLSNQALRNNEGHYSFSYVGEYAARVDDANRFGFRGAWVVDIIRTEGHSKRSTVKGVSTHENILDWFAQTSPNEIENVARLSLVKTGKILKTLIAVTLLKGA